MSEVLRAAMTIGVGLCFIAWSILFWTLYKEEK